MTFGIQKTNTSIVQYYPRLIANHAVAPPVRMNEGFTYMKGLQVHKNPKSKVQLDIGRCKEANPPLNVKNHNQSF